MTHRNGTTLNDRIYYSYEENPRVDKTQFAQRVIFSDGEIHDAFGRLRTSNPRVIYDNYEIQGKKPLRWNEALVGAGTATHMTNQSSIKFATSAASGDKVTRASKKLTLYTPGMSLFCLFTGVMGTGAINSYQRIGIFNDDNGIFFEQQDGVMGVVVRSNTSGAVVNNRVSRSNWNIDKMDGTGASGVNLDFTKTQIFFIDLEWLGVGRVRCGFVHNGNFYICNEFYHNNLLDTVYMKAAILPVTYQVHNYGASTALDDFRQICTSIIVEGDETTSISPRTVSNGSTARSTTTADSKPILSLRIKSAYQNQVMLKPNIISFMTIGNRDHIFEVHFGGTLTGASWVDEGSFAEYDISATALAGSTKYSTIYTSSEFRANVSELYRIWLSADLAGNSDILSIVAKAIGGNGQALSAIDYDEFG
jgi:hypothetical protein